MKDWFQHALESLRERLNARRLRVNLVSQLKKLPQTRADARDLADRISGASAAWFNTVLATDAAVSLDRWLGHATSSPGTIYDRAMDIEYLKFLQGVANEGTQTALGKIEPYYHRLFDGGHDLAAAWEAVRGATPDDTLAREVMAYMAAVSKDVVTPMGLPVDTLDRADFDRIVSLADTYAGASRAWVADAFSYTATELFGATLGAVALALNWNDKDLENFGAIAAMLGVSAIFGANPILGIVAVVGLARTFQRAKLEKEYGSVAHGIAKGGLTTGAFIAGAAALSGPLWGKLLVGIVCAVIAKKAYEQGRANIDISWEDVADFIRSIFRRAKANEVMLLPGL